jgi:phosphocarrier protein FPr
MVGLVIVSHSRALADGLIGLVRQVSPVSVPVAVAAGVGETRQEFGTDAVEIMSAIQSVYSEDGVVVLMDLGSAVLSAQTALDLLPPEMKDHIRFCGAPLVEGAVAAAVQIGLGSGLDAICREASAALAPKREQLGEAPAESIALPVAPLEASASILLTLTNLHGLHARPAAKFVQAAASHQADVTVRDLTNGKGPVSARSLNAIITLGAVENHQIRIDASGPEAAKALEALRALAAANFGEAPAGASAPVEKPAVASAESVPGAIPVSEGIAIGPIFRYEPPLPPIPSEPAGDPAAEWARLEKTLESTRLAIRERRRQLRGSISDEDAAIFEAHELILQDADLLAQVRDRIEKDRQNAAAALHGAMSAIAEGFRALEDPYIQARAADVEDVLDQVLFALAGKAGPVVLPDTPVVLYAVELTPTETSQLDMKRVLGIVTAAGGPTSHSAILARALGIPAIAGAGTRLEHVPAGTTVAVDGFKGGLWIDPPLELRAELATRREAWLEQRGNLLLSSRAPAVTRDGRGVEVAANIGDVAGARAAVENGADGVGLLRTEFLFLTRETAPTEEEQYAALRAIIETMGDRPVIVRTLDVGGDKELPYIHMPGEPNPFLGVRALRLSLTRPDLFLPQLRAILRAALGYACRIMFPMVADLAEVRQARDWVAKAHAELAAEGKPHAWPVELGIMVEIPSVALLSPALAPEVDFFSIGTNDLTQYTLAAERGNPALAHLADGLHPAVLRLIGEVAQASHRAGKWTGICGELGGDPEATAILVGVGVDELSLNPPGIPRVKAAVRALTMPAAHALAEQALQCRTSAEVRELARQFVP